MGKNLYFIKKINDMLYWYFDPLLHRVEQVEAEPVHPEHRPGVGDLAEVVDVVGVAGVADDHLRQGDALLLQHLLRDQPGLVGRVGVHRDRCAGLDVGLADRAHDAPDARGQPGELDGALEDARADLGPGDALADVLDEHLGQGLRHVDQQSRSAVLELVGHVVVRVQARDHDDVELDLGGDLLDARDVSTEPEDGGVHDRVDPDTLELVQKCVIICINNNYDKMLIRIIETFLI
ncbi:hypothetical protein POVWA1_075960 [Plasmodium ovale wallikeri]|uniref:Uncharacterized protein n=1 Tax=Plasmodium ovale wallikeri TaxID=864142 RepID=A0A1A9AII2_PLAOA|nr:hypothetical protein POVWA1_075960 [Plasmodium ovale wallikeri]